MNGRKALRQAGKPERGSGRRMITRSGGGCGQSLLWLDLDFKVRKDRDDMEERGGVDVPGSWLDDEDTGLLYAERDVGDDHKDSLRVSWRGCMAAVVRVVSMSMWIVGDQSQLGQFFGCENG